MRNAATGMRRITSVGAGSVVNRTSPVRTNSVTSTFSPHPANRFYHPVRPPAGTPPACGATDTMPATPGDDDAPLLTRRRALTGIGSAAVGGLGLAIWPTDTASAQVSMGKLNVSGDSATVDGPPERIDVSVTGEFAIDAASVPEMTKIILQLHVGGLNDRVDDVAETSAFGAASGSFEVAADLYDHREVDRGDLMPADPGASETTPVVVRIICQAVSGGSLLAESHVQDTVDLVLARSGLEVRVGGSGDLEVVTA